MCYGLVMSNVLMGYDPGMLPLSLWLQSQNGLLKNNIETMSHKGTLLWRADQA